MPETGVRGRNVPMLTSAMLRRLLIAIAALCISRFFRGGRLRDGQDPRRRSLQAGHVRVGWMGSRLTSGRQRELPNDRHQSFDVRLRAGRHVRGWAHAITAPAMVSPGRANSKMFKLIAGFGELVFWPCFHGHGKHKVGLPLHRGNVQRTVGARGLQYSGLARLLAAERREEFVSADMPILRARTQIGKLTAKESRKAAFSRRARWPGLRRVAVAPDAHVVLGAEPL